MNPAVARSGLTEELFLVEDLEVDVAELKANGVAFEDYDLPELMTVKSIAYTGSAQAALVPRQ